MKAQRFISALFIAILCTAVAPAGAQHAPGHPASGPAGCDCPPGVELASDPWVRLIPPGIPNSAAYLSLRNTTAEDLHIVAAESAAARVTELHEHVQDASGVMRMREVARITIPAMGTVELKPGGLHIMLIELAVALHEGERVPVQLSLLDGAVLRLEAEVRRGPRGAAHGGHHQQH